MVLNVSFLQRGREPPAQRHQTSVVPRRLAAPPRRARAGMAVERVVLESAQGHLHGGAHPEAAAVHLGMLQGVQGADLPQHRQEEGKNP